MLRTVKEDTLRVGIELRMGLLLTGPASLLKRDAASKTSIKSFQILRTLFSFIITIIIKINNEKSKKTNKIGSEKDQRWRCSHMWRKRSSVSPLRITGSALLLDLWICCIRMPVLKIWNPDYRQEKKIKSIWFVSKIIKKENRIFKKLKSIETSCGFDGTCNKNRLSGKPESRFFNK